MKISIISVFPELYNQFLNTSLIKRAQEKGLIKFDLDSYFSFCKEKERIDAPSFGHGSGMLIKPEVVERAVKAQEKKNGEAFKVFFSPQGKRLDQIILKNLIGKVSKLGHLMLLPARYEGMDCRVEEYYADITISIGDYVLMDGDLPAMVFLEGLLRNIQGVVGKKESVEKESFSGPFVDHPEYTIPIEWKGIKVPEIVRSGNHKAIDEWRENTAAQKTVLNHFQWLKSFPMSLKQRKLARKYIPNHYAALMHSGVIIKGREGVSSVTSFDIHDIARSSSTFGLKNFFIVTPLIDQLRIVNTILDFWKTGPGFEYNKNRHEAVSLVEAKKNLEEVISHVKELEKKNPIIIATSAKEKYYEKVISYYDQSKIWNMNRPVLFLFGTAGGLADNILNKSDFLLMPIKGFADFNHLSVRSAAAIVFDRWLGLNLRKVVS